MRTFEIVDSEREGEERPCAILSCDQAAGRFFATVEDWAGPADVPPQFAPTVEKGEREVPEKWVEAWVSERIAPPNRQNIGEILRVHNLEAYDPLELLLSGEGRSSQDGFYLRETTDGFRGGARLGQALSRARAQAGLTQEKLAERSSIKQEAISRIERGKANPTAKTLETLARAMGKRLEIGFED